MTTTRIVFCLVMITDEHATFGPLGNRVTDLSENLPLCNESYQQGTGAHI
jgi:hypothetical protein